MQLLQKLLDIRFGWKNTENNVFKVQNLYD